MMRPRFHVPALSSRPPLYTQIGVAHLDSKSRNLLVSYADHRQHLVIVDISVSVFVDPPDTQVEGFVGAPHCGWRQRLEPSMALLRWIG